MTSVPPTAPQVKSCRSCPSFTRPEDAQDMFGRSIGSPICARFGKVLGKPGLGAGAEMRLQKHVASTCSAWGQNRPGQPQYNTQVMLPDPAFRENIDPSKAFINTCAQCRSFVNEAVVAAETGWTAGMCRARGKLLLGTRLNIEARNCEFKQFGPGVATTDGLHFMPEYDQAFAHAGGDPVQRVLRERENLVDPVDYPTDKPVTPEDETAGIRAWRRLIDPKGTGNEIYLPIFDVSFFDDDERALIPRTGDEEHPELYVDHAGLAYGLAVAWLGLDETPMLNGQPGTGKTEAFRYLAWMMCLPFRRISISASTELDDVFGKYEFIGGETKFKLGYLPIAWTRPCVLVIDEPNTGRPEVWQRLRPLTDNSKQLVMDMWDSRALPRHDDCYMGMAINPAWDIRNIGAMEVADADTNRLFHFFVDMPPEKIEREIVQSRVKLDDWELSDEQLDSLMATAQSIRGLADETQLPVTWAIRQQVKVARALRWFDVISAYRRAIGDYLDPDQLETLLDQVRANWKDVD